MMMTRLGGDVVGMSVVPEVKLAKEKAMCYQPIVLITRYEETSADIEAFEEGVSYAKRMQEDTVKLITGVISYIPKMRGCRCW
jgi:5'-methylthioadenosine phosphorylase